MTDNTSTAEPSTRALREELEMLRARYDSGAISPAIFAVVKQTEIDIAWGEAVR